MKTCSFVLGLFSTTLGAAAADWAPNITTAATWNSNTTNASRSTDVIGALQLRADFAASQRVAIGSADALVLEVDLGTEAWPRFNGLDRAALGPRFTWQHKFGLGAFAPVFSFALAADAIATKESARRALAGSMVFAVRQRLDSVTRIALTHERAREDAREFVFDRSGAETAVTLSRDLDGPWSLAFAARWRAGVVQSYATPPRPDLVALARVRVPNATFDRPLVTYSLDAHTVTGALAVTRTLDSATALTFAYEWRDTTRRPLRYTNHLVSATLARQF